MLNDFFQMSNLKDFFQNAKTSVDRKLDELIPGEDVSPRRLHRAIRWSVFAGGKRFRPALVLAAGQVFGVSENKLLCAAASVEMIHTYSLIHDDLPAMDDDDLRRGRSTCHKKFDEATAILAGDALQNMAFQIIADDENLETKIRLKLISELARAAGTPDGMVAGQQMDLQAEGAITSVEKLEEIHRSKTGAMIRFSAQAGAIIGGANETHTNAITNYAEKLGLLFQVTDDILDITQTTETLGKTAGKDLQAEKATYPAFYGIEETINLAQKICNKAVAELNKIEEDTGILVELAEFILHRKK